MLSACICSVTWQMVVASIGFLFCFAGGFYALWLLNKDEKTEPNKAEERLRDKLRAEKGGDHV